MKREEEYSYYTCVGHKPETRNAKVHMYIHMYWTLLVHGASFVHLAVRTNGGVNRLAICSQFSIDKPRSFCHVNTMARTKTFSTLYRQEIKTKKKYVYKKIICRCLNPPTRGFVYKYRFCILRPSFRVFVQSVFQ